MKKNFSLLIIGILCITFLSCSKNEDGKWDDNIKLSTKLVEFNSNENLTTITTGTNSWWLDGIAFNGTQVDLQQINQTSQNFIVENPDFTVERLNGNIIKIKMKENLTNAERIMNIALQNGNYFDGIKVIQKGN
ncbi:MAG: hypothetical protein ABI549_13095 [Flavobacterium sp.]|uniref:hypothetical protein n=1 Tax=Flavobacterium sp. TaxID=239 RepID=UPI003265FD30